MGALILNNSCMNFMKVKKFNKNTKAWYFNIKIMNKNYYIYKKNSIYLKFCINLSCLALRSMGRVTSILKVKSAMTTIASFN